MKYAQIAALLNQVKSVEESICYLIAEGKNTTPLFIERGRLLQEVAHIK